MEEEKKHQRESTKPTLYYPLSSPSCSLLVVALLFGSPELMIQPGNIALVSMPPQPTGTAFLSGCQFFQQGATLFSLPHRPPPPITVPKAFTHNHAHRQGLCSNHAHIGWLTLTTQNEKRPLTFVICFGENSNSGSGESIIHLFFYITTVQTNGGKIHGPTAVATDREANASSDATAKLSSVRTAFTQGDLCTCRDIGITPERVYFPSLPQAYVTFQGRLVQLFWPP